MQMSRDALQQPPPEHELERHVVPQQPWGLEQRARHCAGLVVVAPCSHPTAQLLRWNAPLRGL